MSERSAADRRSRENHASPPTQLQKAISATMAEMSPVQRGAVWWAAFGSFVAPIGRFIAQDWLQLLGEHEHEGVVQTGFELGWSAFLMLIGSCITIPPLGVWIINHAPLPKSWKRREDRRET